jgi:hypothetical protein
MVKSCSKCGKTKSLNTFHFRKDSGKYRNECKACWKLSQAASRYGITFEQAAEYYKRPHCMCCGVEFTHSKQKHLHHVNHKVRGVMCKDCNILLRQETVSDLNRLKSCLTYMDKPRENLFDKVNQQGSRHEGSLCGPSTTKRRAPNYSLDGLHACKTCKQLLPLKKFYRKRNTEGILKPITSCKECQIIYCKAKQYNLTLEQVAHLRSKTKCDCCSSSLTKVPYIHHVNDKVLGAICRDCNLFLEQETNQVKHRLINCVNWIEGEDIV